MNPCVYKPELNKLYVQILACVKLQYLKFDESAIHKFKDFGTLFMTVISISMQLKSKYESSIYKMHLNESYNILIKHRRGPGWLPSGEADPSGKFL